MGAFSSSTTPVHSVRNQTLLPKPDASQKQYKAQPDELALEYEAELIRQYAANKHKLEEQQRQAQKHRAAEFEAELIRQYAANKHKLEEQVRQAREHRAAQHDRIWKQRPAVLQWFRDRIVEFAAKGYTTCDVYFGLSLMQVRDPITQQTNTAVSFFLDKEAIELAKLDFMEAFKGDRWIVTEHPTQDRWYKVSWRKLVQ
jgi:hypothetical protein